GDAQPLAPNATARGRRRNNRVLVRLHGPKESADRPAAAPRDPCGSSETLAIEANRCSFAGQVAQPISLQLALAGGPAVRARFPTPPRLDAEPRVVAAPPV